MELVTASVLLTQMGTYLIASISSVVIGMILWVRA